MSSSINGRGAYARRDSEKGVRQLGVKRGSVFATRQTALQGSALM